MLSRDSKDYYFDKTFSLQHGFTTSVSGSMQTGQMRQLFFKKILGTRYSKTLFFEPDQIHSDNVLLVKPDNDSLVSGADALIYRKQTDNPVCLVVRVADCVGLVLADYEKEIIAIVHSGWKGCELNIADKTVKEMIKLGARAASIRAVIGPSINSCCYSISTERAQIFKNLYPEYSSQIIENWEGEERLNLPLCVRCQLTDAGIKLYNISSKPFCTSCQSDTFFSYRREGDKAGRMIAYICI